MHISLDLTFEALLEKTPADFADEDAKAAFRDEIVKKIKKFVVKIQKNFDDEVDHEQGFWLTLFRMGKMYVLDAADDEGFMLGQYNCPIIGYYTNLNGELTLLAANSDQITIIKDRN